jgi:hypothetical protein
MNAPMPQQMALGAGVTKISKNVWGVQVRIGQHGVNLPIEAAAQFAGGINAAIVDALARTARGEQIEKIGRT